MSENASSSPPAPTPAPPSAPKANWAKATIWIVVVVFLALNLALFIHSCRTLPGEALDRTGQLIQKTGHALADVASAFRQGRIRTEFISYATSVSNHQHFQFATLKQHEIFTRTEETSTGFGYIPLPDVVVEARAPVEYTYYLDLNDRWDFVVRDNVLYVFTPAIRFHKPAVDVSALTYEVKKGYLKTSEAQENLKRSITSMVGKKALENESLIRENGRRQTEEFVEHWLMRSFTDGKQYPVRVIFPDEKPPNGVTRSDGRSDTPLP